MNAKMIRNSEMLRYNTPRQNPVVGVVGLEVKRALQQVAEDRKAHAYSEKGERPFE
jgi:hypothetical protein